MQHPAVLEARSSASEDADGLTKTKAFVVLQAGPRRRRADDELKAFVKERLAPYKYPRAIEFVDELPKTATGKIQRFRLRERERRGERRERAADRARARRACRGAIGARSHLEYAWVGAATHGAPLVVFLHEGLGSLAMWKRLPARASATRQACAASCISRHGYGRSTPQPRRRALGRRLHAPPGERGAARAASPQLGIERAAWLFGHSDGGSIALLHAARFPDASPAWSRSRRTSSSRTCRSPASSRRATPT